MHTFQDRISILISLTSAPRTLFSIFLYLICLFCILIILKINIYIKKKLFKVKMCQTVAFYHIRQINNIDKAHRTPYI
jgi:hypothetical protein